MTGSIRLSWLRAAHGASGILSPTHAKGRADCLQGAYHDSDPSKLGQHRAGKQRKERCELQTLLCQQGTRLTCEILEAQLLGP
jgi:hypothetical protein